MTSNKKIAKAIRKEIKYHPNQDRMYTPVQLNPKKPSITLELNPSCSRSLYQQMKRETK